VIPLSQWFGASRRFGAAEGGRCVAFGREGERSAADLHRDVAALVARLGSVADRDLLLHCDDAYAFAVGLLATARLGARAVLPPSRQPGALRNLVPKVGGALVDGPPPDALSELSCWHPLEPGGGSPPALDPAPLARDAGLAVLFTSGTTGAGSRIEKAVRHLEDEVAVLEERFGARVGPDTAVIATVAPQHLYGLLFRVLWPLATGRPFLRSAVLHPEELAPYAKAAESFALVSTPATLRHLAARSDLARRRQACRAIFSSGGPLAEDVAHRVGESLGDTPFEVYGSTETGGVAVRQQQRGGERWQSMPGVEVGVDAASGCLAVTSPFVSAGEMQVDGRMRHVTGDRATLFGSGEFALQGRADRIVKVGEKRLSLPDVEACLLRHPSVSEAALIALEKPGAEARVAAVVSPVAEAWDAIASGGRRVLAKTLSEHLAPDFDRVLLPRSWRFVAALPRNAQGKLPTDTLRALFDRESPSPAPEQLGVRREEGVIETHLRLPWDLSFLDGHFPGQPIVPGVAQIHFAMGALEDLLGEAPAPATLEALKFHEVLLPGEEVRLRVELTDGGRRFRFSLANAARAERLYASGRGTLERGT
jgi:acyl-coenzyme A synthetase/AMP-(fatty) acid ligase/3-hydroxymyristoyl/3-hydroxydecanoyl-(acyl carrier protein) dehydratase